MLPWSPTQGCLFPYLRKTRSGGRRLLCKPQKYSASRSTQPLPLVSKMTSASNTPTWHYCRAEFREGVLLLQPYLFLLVSSPAASMPSADRDLTQLPSPPVGASASSRADPGHTSPLGRTCFVPGTPSWRCRLFPIFLSCTIAVIMET